MSDERDRAARAAWVEAMRAVLSEVEDERMQQREKWGEQSLDDGTGSASHEVVLSAVRRKASWGAIPTWANLLEEEVAEALVEVDPAWLRAELVQVAAVCVQWVEALDRRKS